jgi:hypothetical protein
MTRIFHPGVCLFAALSISKVFLNAQTNEGTLDSAVAPPLAEQIPAEALVYVGWSGLAAIQEQARQSPRSALWTNGRTADIGREVLPLVLNYVNSENPRMAGQMQWLWTIALGLRDHPTGFYFAGMTCEKDGLPYPRLGFISRVGDAADAVATRLSFVDQIGRDLNLPIRMHCRDGIVRITLGDEPSPETTLADLPEFKSLINRQKNVPAVWTYVNVARLPEAIESSAQALPRFARGAAGRWNTWKESLALAPGAGFLWSAGFEDGHWVTRGNLAASAPRHGLLRALDTRPITAELLRVVPATASMAGAFQVRPDMGLPALEALLERVDSPAATRLNEGNRLAKTVLGVDPRAQLTKSLGRQWAYYCDKETGGGGLDGLVMVNALQDAHAFRTWLPPVMALLQRDPASTNHGVSIQQLESDGRMLWRIEWSGSAVVLGICGNNLVVSRRMETVMAACRSIGQAGTSILDQDEFQAMRERLGAESAGAFWYADLRQSAPLPQLMWSAFDEAYRTVARAASLNAPALPSPWTPISKHLGPAGAFVSTDNDGWHLVTSSPFPGAAVIAEPLVLLAPLTLAAEPLIEAIDLLRVRKARLTRNSP